jgi:hypothetical protein
VDVALSAPTLAALPSDIRIAGIDVGEANVTRKCCTLIKTPEGLVLGDILR